VPKARARRNAVSAEIDRRPATGANLADANRLYANGFGQFVLADAHWLKKLCFELFAKVNVWQLFHVIEDSLIEWPITD
jgi:hypothetical protein